MGKREYRVRKIRFQIVTDIGETIGLPIDTFEEAEKRLNEVLIDDKLLEELCPDTDIETIKFLAIDPVVDDYLTTENQHDIWNRCYN